MGLIVQDLVKTRSQAVDFSTEKTQRFPAKSDPLKFLFNNEDIPDQMDEQTCQSQSRSFFVSTSAAQSSSAGDRTVVSESLDLAVNVDCGNLHPETPFRGALEATSSSATDLFFPASAISSSRYMLCLLVPHLACISAGDEPRDFMMFFHILPQTGHLAWQALSPTTTTLGIVLLFRRLCVTVPHLQARMLRDRQRDTHTYAYMHMDTSARMYACTYTYLHL